MGGGPCGELAGQHNMKQYRILESLFKKPTQQALGRLSTKPSAKLKRGQASQLIAC